MWLHFMPGDLLEIFYLAFSMTASFLINPTVYPKLERATHHIESWKKYRIKSIQVINYQQVTNPELILEIN